MNSERHLRKAMEPQTASTPSSRRGWVITEGTPVRLDPSGFDPEAESGSVKEYRISEIGRYLLNPGPIEIHKRLVGCEAHPEPSLLNRVMQRVPGWGKTRRRRPDVLLSGFKLKLPAFQAASTQASSARISATARLRLSREDT